MRYGLVGDDVSPVRTDSLRRLLQEKTNTRLEFIDVALSSRQFVAGLCPHR